jgi:hypothetical protein
MRRRSFLVAGAVIDAYRHRQPRHHGQGPPVDDPAAGALPEGVTATEQMDDKLRTSEGRAAYRRRAPGIEGIHARVKLDANVHKLTTKVSN